MEQKASLHLGSLKSMSVAQSNENERREWKKESYDRNVDYSGKPCNYDWFRRHLNFEIVDGKIRPMLSQEIPLHERLQNRLRELGFKNYKKDAKNAPNICIDFMIGGNQKRLREMAFGKQEVIFGKNEERNSSLTRCQDIENWALDTYRWAAKKYGEENIVGFNVHLDETTPHIHMQVVPVGQVKKRGRVKAGEERGTKLAVNYYGVVGNSPEERAAYTDNLHTDYHLQVGYKYGLERGTFYADLTPEEQYLRKHRTGAEYVIYKETMKKVDDIKAQIQQAEKKQKSLSTMVHNLEEKRDSLLADIADLEKEGGYKTSELEEKRQQLDATTAMLQDKQEKLSEAKAELKNLDETRNQTKEKIKTMADDAIRRHDSLNAKMKETENAIKEKRAELARFDKTGELKRAHKHIEAQDNIIYRIWPEARNAIAAIFEFGNSNIATNFTPQQALDVEKAIAFSGTSRTDAAKDLLALAEKDFDNHRTPRGWVDSAAKEVMSIARGTHQRLTALLKQQPKDSGGGPSYITDLTDWAGNQVKL